MKVFSQAQLEELAKPYFEKGIPWVYATTDGNIFLPESRNAVELHARSNAIEVLELRAPKEIQAPSVPDPNNPDLSQLDKGLGDSSGLGQQDQGEVGKPGGDNAKPDESQAGNGTSDSQAEQKEEEAKPAEQAPAGQAPKEPAEKPASKPAKNTPEKSGK